ncbi:MAG: ABC transporter permease [Ignavibacteria bacterium]|nr:ABC transporter permease [Ignavibacteria bacterium]
MRAIQAIIARNLIKFFRNKMRLALSIFMSGLFLFIFSFISNSAISMLSHPMSYLISGIIIMTVFQTSMNNSMNILEDIASGFMKEILVAPIARWQIAIGQVASSAIVSVLQGIIIVIIGIFMGLRLDIYHSFLMICMMLLVGLTFSSLGLLLAALTKESTNFQMLVSIVTIPLTFLSGAYIPAMSLPDFLLPIVYLNPLTYTTAAFRFITLRMENMPDITLVRTGISFNINGFIISPLISALITAFMCAIFFYLCVKQFTSADFSKVKAFKHRH